MGNSHLPDVGAAYNVIMIMCMNCKEEARRQLQNQYTLLNYVHILRKHLERTIMMQARWTRSAQAPR